jgi:hypothetical protein
VVIDTTRSHLFWVPATSGGGRWIKAAALTYGTHLRTPTSTSTATAASGWTANDTNGWMWDLTIPGNNDHDFYIQPVLPSAIRAPSRAGGDTVT